MKRLGLIVNPVAGMRGKVGLKGTDGPEILERAIELGAMPIAPHRAVEALRIIRATSRYSLKMVTCPQRMGEQSAKDAGFQPETIEGIPSQRTTSEDTKRAAKSLQARNVDLLLFVGGDGTARDIYDAIDRRITCLGIPAGVKVYSSVFSINPQAGGNLATRYLDGETSLTDAEILDVDESDYRSDRISVRLYGYLRVPFHATNLQTSKTTSPLGEDEEFARDSIAKFVEEELKDDWTYVIGPGTTTAALGRRLGFEKTVLGVDAIRGKTLVAKDLSEQGIMRLLGSGKAAIIVTPIGGQGFIFGRGNPQISTEVIKRVGRNNIIVVATKRKIHSLKTKHLLVDTGDPELDSRLSGHMKVITGYKEFSVLPVNA